MERTEYGIIAGIALIAVFTGIITTTQSIATYLLTTVQEAVNLTIVMAWETWWALVLGFAIAGAVEAWIPKATILDYLQEASLKELGYGTLFGFLSSSCSFSAVATAKNLFKKGASAAASLGAFMFASTNLVIEIGLVMWILLGWQFVVADFIGGLFLILCMALAFGLHPRSLIETARQHAIDKEGITATDPVCGMDVDITEAQHTVEHDGHSYYFCSPHCLNAFNPDDHTTSVKQQLTSLTGWRALADKQWKEWSMLAEDIIIGFILAGIIGAFVPDQIWISLFSGQTALGLPLYVAWTAILGAIIGVVTFVCSVGNIPFAAILWNNGLPFGSVLSYIYADLIVPPIIHAYKKYYGVTFAAVLSATIFAAAVFTGVVTHFIFDLAGFIPQQVAVVTEKTIHWNAKAYLNIIFTLIFLGLYKLRTS